MADSPGGNAGNPFSGLTDNGNERPAEGSSNDPFAKPANGSAAPGSDRPATVDAPPGVVNSAQTPRSNGNGLPFKVSGQTEPVKVRKGAALPAKASEEPTNDPFRRNDEPPPVEAPPAPEPPTYAPPPIEEVPPQRAVDDRRAEDERIFAHTQRVRGGYGYVPYTYEEERKPLFADPRIWGSLLAATAIGVILAIVVVVAGGSGDGQVAGVSDEVQAAVVIEAPEEGATIAAAQPYTVRALVTHPDGVQQVDLQVNGSPVATDSPDSADGNGEPPSNFTAELEWTPEDEGQYTLAIVGVTPSGERFGEEQRTVTVAFPAGSEAFVVALDPTNVREFPSTDERSQSFGQLQPGEERRILQRTSTGAGGWFLIEFPASPTGQGWVLEQLVDTRGDITAVQSVEPPALPTPEPTPTETPEATPSETPESLEFDLEPAGYDEDEGYVEIKNNGPGDFRGYIVLFYLTADTTSGCQLDTQSGNYPIEGVQIAANQVVSVRFNTPQPDGLFCIGISVENDQDPENNAIGPYQKTG